MRCGSTDGKKYDPSKLSFCLRNNIRLSFISLKTTIRAHKKYEKLVQDLKLIQ